MIDSFLVKDNFCSHPEVARQSAFDAGFDTWLPNKGKIGSSIYDGMAFKGYHEIILRALTQALGRMIYPRSMFFRATRPDTEKAYIHSDRTDGDYTCITYLSEHNSEQSGTGFYRHRKTGLLEMPDFSEMEDPKFDELKRDMVEGGDEAWELCDFVRGHFNRALIFHAPLFHARHPKNGFGDGSFESARIVHVCHFFL